MKSSIRTLVSALALLVAGGASWSVMAQGMGSNLVLLRINDSGTALEYNAAGSNHGVCQNPGQGCVRVSGQGSITFRLVEDRRCGTGAMWELDGVQLGGENAGKPGAWGNLSERAASDFDADAASGWARTSPSSGQAITLYDANSAAYSLWYRVSATCGDDTIWFDPRIENEGTN